MPMIDEIARALARLARRDRFTGDEDLVFCGRRGGHLIGRVVSRNYHAARERAGLRYLRFHDLRHTFGTHAIRTADTARLMEWMGHEDLRTTLALPSIQAEARRGAAWLSGSEISAPVAPTRG